MKVDIFADWQCQNLIETWTTDGCLVKEHLMPALKGMLELTKMGTDLVAASIANKKMTELLWLLDEVERINPDSYF